MRVEIKAGDAVRVTAHNTITNKPLLMLWLNNRPAGYIDAAQAAELRRVVKDPECIALGDGGG